MNLAYLRIEIKRLIRNRRVLIFSVLLPALLLLIFGGIDKGDQLNGVGVAEYLMVSMGVFGSMSAAIGSGGSIAVERGLGWNRQLRLTGLEPNGYVLTKLALSLLMALPPIVTTYLVGAAALHVRLPAQTWLLIGGLSWLGALPFAALGLVGPATCAGRWPPEPAASWSRTPRRDSWPTPSGGSRPVFGWWTPRWPRRHWPAATVRSRPARSMS
jgi:ABC-2 type transport system permease protein